MYFCILFGFLEEKIITGSASPGTWPEVWTRTSLMTSTTSFDRERAPQRYARLQCLKMDSRGHEMVSESRNPKINQILSAEMENLRKLESNHRFSNEYNVYT